MTAAGRVALLSIDPLWEDPSGEFLPFTYGVRKLAASLRSDPTLSDVEVHIVDLRERDPEAFFAALTEIRPTLVAASLYLWSIAPFQKLAARIKGWDPSVQIVVGGPHARTSVFSLAPYRELGRHVDAAVTGEGEGILREIVRRHGDADWTSMPGLLVPHALGWRTTGDLERPDIEAFPTPYQIDDAPHGRTGYIETFRGCPIHCNFCQWGEQRADRVHSVEYLASHLLGLQRANVPNIFCLDAAFNLSPRGFRNLAEAERQTGVLKTSHVHGHLYPTFLRDEHVELLTSFGGCQVAIGVQSFDADVLHRLGRPFDLERFERVCDVVRKHWPIDLELMLGLPGDTPESFRRTFEHAIEIGDSVRVFRTLVLPDALLDRAEPSLKIEFDPESWLITSCLGWTPQDLDRELDYVKKVSLQHENAVVADNWAGFQVRRRAEQSQGLRTHKIDSPRDRQVSAVEPSLVEDIRRRVADVQGWRLRTVRNQFDGLYFDLDSPSGHIQLEAVVADPDRRAFETRGNVAYSHRGEVSRAEVPQLRQIIDLVHGDAVSLVTRE